ncbi:MAG: MnmC family methyltransferase [Planctomycetota bacterium]
MSWIPLRTADGSWTLRHGGHGEACHSRSGAWLEARERYARACRLPERSAAEGALRLLDVGTGLGLNIAAGLEALAPAGIALQVVTLEREREVVEAGIALYGRLEARVGPWTPFVDQVHRALRIALSLSSAQAGGHGVPLGAQGSLRLLVGDARAEIARLAGEAPFAAVFLDPFSPPREPELWEESFLAALARRMGSGSWLSTYSAAFAVRLGLARAGLRVGQGPAVGAKAEGTLASPDRDPPPLPPAVTRRLLRELG